MTMLHGSRNAREGDDVETAPETLEVDVRKRWRAIAMVDEDGTVTCVGTAEEYGQRRKWVKVRRSNFTLARKE